MKKIFTILTLAALAMPAYSQITLTESDCPVPTDTAYFIGLPAGSYFSPSAGANQAWGYDTLNLSGATTYPLALVPDAGDPVFTSAQFSEPGGFKNLTSALGYYITDYFDVTASGTQDIGTEAPEQHFGIGALTGNAADSLIVLDSKDYYPSSPRVIFPFPVTASTSWSSVTRHVVNMTLTVTSQSLNNAPLTHVFYYYRHDSIIGWGKFNAPSGSGTSGNLDVLMDRQAQYSVDSFYLNGSPAPAQLLSAFGLTQGGQPGPFYYRDYFLRSGSWTEAIEFLYTDNTYTTQNGAYLNKNLPVSTGINSIAAGRFSSACPNPMNGNAFDIRMDANTQVSSVTIQDISGRVADQIAVVNNGGTVHVQTHSTLPDGLYIYSVTGTDGNVITKGKATSVN